MTRREIERAFPAIERFAEIGGFMNRPVKEYSSGMYIRLAFSTAIHVEPEILIVDEALAVGDAVFSNRCIQKFEELRARKITVLFVSHDLGLVKRLSDRAALLVDGRVVMCGYPSDVVNRYVGFVLERQAREQPAPALTSSHRHGDGASRVEHVAILNSRAQPVTAIEPGEPVTIRILARAERDLENPVVGVLLRTRLGTDVWGTNTRIEGLDIGSVAAGDAFEVDFTFDCLLTGQDYTLTVATQYQEGYSQEWLDDMLMFTVADARQIAGVANFKTRVKGRRIQNASRGNSSGT
jgi:hypothetical protein